MANPEHLAILKQGVNAWNEWRETDKHTLAALKGANLRLETLTPFDFWLVDFKGADLSGANPSHATMHYAWLNEANFYNAFLIQTNFISSRLDNANLQQVGLSRAKIEKTTLDGTDFAEARLAQTIFADVDLSKAKHLDKVSHIMPSTVGIDTIYRSGGNIPEVFLRGCGVPETFIAYAHSLVGKPIDFYSCFISHSSKDKRFCERLYVDLQAKTVRVWYFPEDAKWGEPLWGEIDRSIKKYDKLIVVCSKNSLVSGPVLREIERALNREDKEGKNVLFPITVDRYLFDEWEHPRKDDVLAKVVGTDFIGWNRDATKYDKAFKKLLKALKAS